MTALLAGLLLCAASLGLAEDHVREVPVAATLKDGSPVGDLTAQEIEIKETGRHAGCWGSDGTNGPWT